MNFTMLHNCLGISTCCAIICDFQQVVQLFWNFIGVVGVSHGDIGGVVEVMSWYFGGVVTKKSIMSLNEEYFSTITLTH